MESTPEQNQGRRTDEGVSVEEFKENMARLRMGPVMGPVMNPERSETIESPKERGERLTLESLKELDSLRENGDRITLELKRAQARVTTLEYEAKEWLPPAKEVEILATQKKVRILGLECPMISLPEEKFPYVPAIDPLARLDVWRASVKAGPMTIKHTAVEPLKLLMEGKRVQLIGPPGTGKTYLWTQLCALLGWPVIRFNLKEDTNMDEILGSHAGVGGGKTVFVDGPLVYAMEHGCVFIADEWDRCPSECSAAMMPAMEADGFLTLSAVDGQSARVVKPHPNFRMVFTSNTGGVGNNRGLYSGTKILDGAATDRIQYNFIVDYLTPSAEAGLLVKTSGIPRETALKIVGVARDVRKASSSLDATISRPISMRQTMAWADGIRLFKDVSKALSLSVLSGLPECDVAPVVEIAQRHMGDDIKGDLPA